MAEGFWEGLGRHLFNWFGWVFTVGGAIFGIILARDYWWISLLLVIALSAALGGLTFRKHQELRKAEARVVG